MRLFAITLLLLLVIPPDLAAAQPNPSCRKNIVVYFDNSDSMEEPATSGDGSIRDLMLKFLEGSLRSPQFASESDSLKVKLFVDKATPVWSLKPGEALTPKRKEAAFSTVKQEIQKLSGQDNDYETLAEDFESELSAISEGSVATTYLVVFSDFFYNPSAGTQAEWKEHSNKVQRKLAELEPLFEEKRAKLVYWYQPNKQKDGVDLVDLFRTLAYARQVPDVRSISQLVEAVSRELRLPLLLNQNESRFLYGGDGLKLRLAFRNTSCAPIHLEEVKVDRIETPSLLTQPSVAAIRKSIPAGESFLGDIRLQGSPGLAELRSKFLNQTYDVTVTPKLDLPAGPRTIQVRLDEKAFKEEITPDSVEAVVVRHLVPRYDRLFLRFKLKGNLLDKANLRARVYASAIEAKAINPGDDEPYTVQPADLNAPRIFVFSLQDSNQILRSLNPDQPGELQIQWSLTRAESDAGFALNKGKDIRPDTLEHKDYRAHEWSMLAIIFLGGIGIRVRYARQRK